MDFRRVTTCESAIEAWDILKTIHKGTTRVKISRIQKLTKHFENLTIRDSESFDNFYNKLNDIFNTSFNLGEKILL